MKNMSKASQITYYMVLVALFSALCFAGVFVSIPLGVSKIHLGNFFCIIAGLLCGGLVGGISGSLGMGLNDLMMGYGIDTIIRTFITKFLVGLIAGLLFRFIVKKRKNLDFINLCVSVLFFLLTVLFVVLYVTKGNVIAIGEKKFKYDLFVIISLGLFSIFFLLIYIFSKKIKEIQKYVLIATAVSCLFNIIIEFILKVPFKMLFADMTFEQAFIYAVSSLPNALITAIITTVAIVIIYLPTYYATRRFNRLDTLYQSIKEITNMKE